VDVDGVIHDIVHRLEKYDIVQRVVLFGSRARGDEHPRSDIDLAVAAPDATDGKWNRMWADVEDVETLLTVDLIRLDQASPEFHQRILTEGRLLYERDADQTESGESWPSA
jgi:uncharacterized protein